MGKFVEHLKRKAESAGCEVIELNAYKLKMSQYDPQTDAYRKKPLKERWHRWGNTGTLGGGVVMNAGAYGGEQNDKVRAYFTAACIN